MHKGIALRWAAGKGYADIVKVLLANNNSVGTYRYFAHSLFESSIHGHTEVVTQLINFGIETSDCNMALAYATVYNHIDIVKLLLDKGARLNNALDWARRSAENKDSTEILKLLKEAGCYDPR